MAHNCVPLALPVLGDSSCCMTNENWDWNNQPHGASHRFLPLKPRASARRLILELSCENSLGSASASAIAAFLHALFNGSDTSRIGRSQFLQQFLRAWQGTHS